MLIQIPLFPAISTTTGLKFNWTNHLIPMMTLIHLMKRMSKLRISITSLLGKMVELMVPTPEMSQTDSVRREMTILWDLSSKTMLSKWRIKMVSQMDLSSLIKQLLQVLQPRLSKLMPATINLFFKTTLRILGTTLISTRTDLLRSRECHNSWDICLVTLLPSDSNDRLDRSSSKTLKL